VRPAGRPESYLTRLGVSNAALRRLRYLELPAWHEVDRAATALCRDPAELERLRQLWLRDQADQQRRLRDDFGRA